jgi:hypothetical protein
MKKKSYSRDIYIVMLHVVISYKIINYYLLFVLMKPKMQGERIFFVSIFCAIRFDHLAIVCIKSVRVPVFQV